MRLDPLWGFASAVCLGAIVCSTAVSRGGARRGLEEGFVAIFDGKTLQGWRVVPREATSDWTVRDGVVVGHGSAKRLCYLVWRDERLRDFELHLRYRLRPRTQEPLPRGLSLHLDEQHPQDLHAALGLRASAAAKLS